MTTITRNTFVSQVAEAVSHIWWIILLRGMAAILLGIGAFMQPGMTAVFFTTLLAAYVLVDGVFALIGGIMGKTASRGWSIVSGLLAILAGGLVLAQPLLATGLSTFMMMLMLATGLIVSGVTGIWAAIRLRKELDGSWMLMLVGLVPLLFGAIVLANPFVTVLTLISISAIFAILSGIALIFLAFRIKNLPNKFK